MISTSRPFPRCFLVYLDHATIVQQMTWNRARVHRWAARVWLPNWHGR